MSVTIPDNFPDCFAAMERHFDAKRLDKLRRRPEDELSQEHFFGWGLYLRNRFIHPRNSPLAAKLAELPNMWHHDSCGSFMLKAFWAHLNGKLGPQAALNILIAQWAGIMEVTPLIYADKDPEELRKALEHLQEEKPTLEQVLPLYRKGN